MISLLKSNSLILFGLFGILVVAACLSEDSYATTYNLEEMSIDVPSQFDVAYDTEQDGSKTFTIYDSNSNFFGSIGYHAYDVNGYALRNFIDNVKENSVYYGENNQACNDGSLSINNNYCIVSFCYKTDSDKPGMNSFTAFTQVRDGLNAQWVFLDRNSDDFNNKLPTIFNIVNSMKPHFDNDDDYNNNDRPIGNYENADGYGIR